MDRFYRAIFQFVQTYIKIKIGWHCGHSRRNSIYIPHLCRVHRVYLMVRQKCAPEIWHFFYCTTSQRVTLNSPITREGIYGQFFKIFRRKTNSANAFVAWTARTIRRLIILRYFTRMNRCVVALNVRDAAVNCARFFLFEQYQTLYGVTKPMWNVLPHMWVLDSTCGWVSKRTTKRENE